MTDNKAEPGIPEKPLLPPSFDDQNAVDAVSDHPAHTRNVQPKSRWLRFGKAGSQADKAAPALNAAPTDKGRPGGRKLAWYWIAGAAAVLLVGGIVVGTTIPDPKKSSQYAALALEKDGVSGQLDSLQARFDNLAAGAKSRESAIAAREAAVAKAAADVKTAEAGVKTAEAAVKTREEAVTGAEKAKAANTVKEGTWTVGVDIEPGTYRADSEVTSGCYWGIYRTGSNGSDIVDNDIVSGGRPSVTLSPGQDFKTSRCGTWSKQ